MAKQSDLVKVQLNLYKHRDIDRLIIEQLGLDTTANPNALVKDLLYKLANKEQIQAKPKIINNINKHKVEHKKQPEKANNDNNDNPLYQSMLKLDIE